MIAWDQQLAHLHFAENLLGVKFDQKQVTWLTSLDQSGRVLGVVVFSRFTSGNCEITVAACDKRFISKKFALAVALYPFVQLNCRRVTAIIAVDNVKSLNLAEQLGFKREGRLSEWYSSGDAIILGLLRKDCKWIKDKTDGLPTSSDSSGPDSHS